MLSFHPLLLIFQSLLVVDLVVLSADVIGTSLVISVVYISSVDEVVSDNAIILSVAFDVDDDDDVENVLFDIDVASSVVLNSKVVPGCIVVDSSVVVNSTFVSGTVFVDSIVHDEKTRFVVVEVTVSE